jgi:hypothetical protein
MLFQFSVAKAMGEAPAPSTGRTIEVTSTSGGFHRLLCFQIVLVLDSSIPQSQSI